MQASTSSATPGRTRHDTRAQTPTPTPRPQHTDQDENAHMHRWDGETNFVYSHNANAESCVTSVPLDTGSKWPSKPVNSAHPENQSQQIAKRPLSPNTMAVRIVPDTV